MRILPIVGLAAAALMASVTPGAAQSVVARTPNILGGWIAPRGVIQFNFLHRFSISDPPLRKITNTPTFNIATGIVHELAGGFVYGSNSALIPAFPNEWEFYARALPWSEEDGAPLDVSLQGGYNVASQSIDGELLLARGFGPLKVLAAGRAFSDGYDGTEARYALAAGLSVRITQRVSLSGDYGVLLDRADDEDAAWAAGVQIGVPYTPHSFSIHVSNVGTASLEGASRGGATRWGFEYTVPITLGRYGRSRDDSDRTAPSSAAPAQKAMAPGDSVFVDIEALKYTVEEIVIEPGTTVVWRNRDPVRHSVTADDESFDSGLIDGEASYTMTLTTLGEYPFHCAPHPFMKGRVVVREALNHPERVDRGEVAR